MKWFRFFRVSFRYLAGKRVDLSERDASIIWRDSLMPVGADSVFGKKRDGSFSQELVLKAATGKNDPRLFRFPGNGQNNLSQRVMESC